MTIEQKAALYDVVVKERDAYAHLLAKFFDRFRSGCFNGFNELWKDKDGNPIKTFGVPFDELRKKFFGSRDQASFEMMMIFDTLSVCGVKFDELAGKGPAEIEAILPKVIDVEKTYADLHKWDREPTEEQKKAFSLTDEQITFALITFFYEYQFGHVYPGDENEIYRDAYRQIMLAMMNRVGIKPDRESIVKWCADFREKLEKEVK